MPSGTISLLRVGTNSSPINSEKLTTELNGPHFLESQKTSNLTLDLEIHQHLGSLKYVINIIIWIKDTGCYNITHTTTYTYRNIYKVKRRSHIQLYLPIKNYTKYLYQVTITQRITVI
jgi:hypothetical protein